MKAINIFFPLLLNLVSVVSFAQTGIGGVGNTSGTSTLRAWYNANRGVSTNVTSVTQWADQSGYGNNATPPAVTNRPTFTAAAVNTYPVVTFDGIDDFLTVPDAASLDLTTWSIFVVGRITTHKNFNAIVQKGLDAAENYEFLTNFPSTGDIHYPVLHTDGTRTTFSGGVFSNTVYGVYQLDYNQVNFQVYVNGTNVATNAQNRIPRTNTNNLWIGNEEGISGRNFSGTLAEIAIFSSSVNSAQRIIINNSLSAKYNFSLASEDIYDEDNFGFDHDVAGIGRVDASNIHNDAQGTGIVRILNPSGLGNNEFLIWGHNNGALAANEASDVPVGVQARLIRVWRASEVNASASAVDVGSIDMRWDLTGLGNVTASNLRLLVDTDDDGIFSDETPISGATSLGGNIYAFAGVSTIENNRRFTLGTINTRVTPLPIELISFNVIAQDNQAKIDWQTALEINNNYFVIERSKNGLDWEEVKKVKGAGNSSILLTYTFIDENPHQGTSYYRLKQKDFDGKLSYSRIQSIHIGDLLSLKIYPNPTENTILVVGKMLEDIKIFDELGREVTSVCKIKFDSETSRLIDMSNLSRGLYYIKSQTTAVKVHKQ